MSEQVTPGLTDAALAAWLHIGMLGLQREYGQLRKVPVEAVEELIAEIRAEYEARQALGLTNE